MKSKLVNHVAIVLDSSSSMNAYENDVIKSFNNSVESIRSAALREKQDTTVSFYTFGDYVKREFMHRQVKDLRALTRSEYRPDGMTALLDAVGTAIADHEALPDANSKNTSFLILVKTDGGENASRVHSSVSLRQAIDRVNRTDRWTIAFLVPPGSKSRLCSQYEIPEGNVQEWETTAKGVQEASRATAQGVQHYYQTRSAGGTSTQAFYTDLSKVKTTAVKRALDDVTSVVSVWNVPKEEEISTFCERRSRKPYRQGAAFYELTKRELIQSNKHILVQQRDTGVVWAGSDARSLLGIPDGDVKVTPGNHANYVIYVQSTSSNRKLVRGSHLVYCKSGVYL